MGKQTKKRVAMGGTTWCQFIVIWAILSRLKMESQIGNKDGIWEKHNDIIVHVNEFGHFWGKERSKGRKGISTHHMNHCSICRSTASTKSNLIQPPISALSVLFQQHVILAKSVANCRAHWSTKLASNESASGSRMWLELLSFKMLQIDIRVLKRKHAEFWWIGQTSKSPDMFFFHFFPTYPPDQSHPNLWWPCTWNSAFGGALGGLSSKKTQLDKQKTFGSRW